MAYQVDDLDRQIIRILQEDGRESNVEIARLLGLSEATVRKRLDRLVSEHIIRPTVFPDLAHLGLETGTLVAFQVDLNRIGPIAERLANLPQVRSVYYTTGEYDLFIEAVFPSNRELLHFLTVEIAAIEGIRKSATFHILKRVKEQADWTLPRPPAPTILVVDDDPDFVQATRIVLESHGWAVLSAANGDEALSCLQHNRPDLVIMDIMMHGILDGLDASRQIQADPQLKNIPILVVSSIADSDYAEMFPTEGEFPADRFLTKPVAPEQLVAQVRRLLARTKTL